MCIRIYIFNLKTKQNKTRRQKKAKETKQKRICGKLTGYDDVVCESALCTFNLPDYLFIYFNFIYPRS